MEINSNISINKKALYKQFLLKAIFFDIFIISLAFALYPILSQEKFINYNYAIKFFVIVIILTAIMSVPSFIQIKLAKFTIDEFAVGSNFSNSTLMYGFLFGFREAKIPYALVSDIWIDQEPDESITGISNLIITTKIELGEICLTIPGLRFEEAKILGTHIKELAIKNNAKFTNHPAKFFSFSKRLAVKRTF